MAILPINTPFSVFQVRRGSTSSEGSAFAEILGDASQKKSTALPDAAKPLSKAQLSEIVTAMRSQMNRRLVSAFSSTACEEPDFPCPHLSDVIAPAPEESSKKYRPNQNNDVFKVREDLELIINQASEAYDVDPALIKSVIRVESNFNPNSTSSKGAMGLMQLMPGTARDLGVQNAYDPVENVRAGTRYLKSLLKRYDGNVELALAAYNWGMGNIEKRPERMPEETRNYVKAVTRYYTQATV